MVGTRSEDTLLFLGLTPNVTKIKPIYKMLIDFANKKQSLDFSDRFNIILFQESGPVYLDDFTLNFDNILSLLKDYEKKIVRANIAGGIFVAATFIIDVYKKISDKAFRLIILMDKEAYKIPENYLPVLYNLLDKVRDMPFYLDILRLGARDPEEYPKLDNLTKRYGGRIYEIKTPKILQEHLDKAAEKKVVFQESFMARTVGPNTISIENQPFYANLADDPKILLSMETCSICFKKDDKTVVQCPNCDTITHMSCWANWAKNSNIGMPYVFRCHICFNLIKLDKEFVEIVQTGKEPAPEIEPKKIDIVSYLQQMETKRAPQVIQGEDPLAVPKETYSERSEPERTMTEPEQIDLEPIPKPAVAIHFETTPKTADTLHLEPIPKPDEIKASEKKADKRRGLEVTVVFCPSCSKITTNMSKNCPFCGFSLK